MRAAEWRALRRRAKQLGVQAEFIDATGERRDVSAETLRVMIQLLGDDNRDPPLLPPVIVCWDGKPIAISLLRDAAHITATLLARESRDASAIPVKSTRGSPATLHFPPLAFGYYELCVELNGVEHRSLVMCAPRKAFAQRGMRSWGLFAPLYATHSKQSWSAGNLSDWQQLCKRLGSIKTNASGVVAATLPLMGAFLDDWKCEPSPYSPATRLFWNEFYLDITRVPEFAASKAARRMLNASAFQRGIATMRRSNVVDYQREMALKRRIIEQLASEFFHQRTRRHRAFEEFLKQRPELQRYAAFRATCEARQESWQAWPEPLRRGTIRSGDYDEATKRYHLFAQWLVQEQMDTVLASCHERGVKFYLDLPLGVNPDGYDVWANQHQFLSGASVGAPPDAFFTKGQDWGFPPLHPQRMRDDQYRYVIDYLRYQMRHTGLLRIDHVMGLHRLWLVPRGASAAGGVYVRYNAEELYAILCLESHQHQTMLAGENLGTVPPEVNRSMRRHGVRTMYVAQYEMQPNAKETLREPPRDCVASINTHDMPMWAAYWKGMDITDRQQLGLLSPHDAREEKKRRAHLRKTIEQFLRRKELLTGKADARDVLAALLIFLARSKAELVLVNLEDLWLETAPQNTPGTSSERVNWKRKMRYPVEDAMTRQEVRHLFELLAAER